MVGLRQTFPGVCDYRLAICRWIRMGDYGVVGLLRRESLSLLYQAGMIRRFRDSLFAGHLGVSRTVYRLQNRVYWPGLYQDIRSYLASCPVCLARKSPCPRRAPMGHVDVGHRWDRVVMDLLDMSVTTAKGNQYVLVMVDCFFQMDGSMPIA